MIEGWREDYAFVFIINWRMRNSKSEEEGEEKT